MTSEVRKVWGIKYPNDSDHYLSTGGDWWAVRPNPDNDFVIGALAHAMVWNSEIDAIWALYAARVSGKNLRMTAPGCLQPRPSPFYIRPDCSRTEEAPTFDPTRWDDLTNPIDPLGLDEMAQEQADSIRANTDPAKWGGKRNPHNVPPNYTFAGYTDFGAVQVPRYEDMEHSGKRLMDAWWKLADTAASMLPKPTSKSRQLALAHDILDMLQ